MKLSNYVRDAFINAVMQDVPKEKDHSEEIRKIATDDLLSQVPDSVKKVWKDDAARPFLKECYSSFDIVSIAHPARSEYRHSMKLSSKAQTKVDKLIAEMSVDRKNRKELCNKLKGIAYGCTTLKQLRDLLPEFVKYMPEEDKPLSANLPMVTNIVSDFVKAGWKGSKK